MSTLDVFEYTDYRVYMKTFYEEKKRSPGSFSYRRFSKIAGNASPNFVKLVVDGQRNLTVENIHKFAVAMGLEGLEHDYFVALVHFTQEGDPGTKDYYNQIMARLKFPAKSLSLSAAGS